MKEKSQRELRAETVQLGRILQDVCKVHLAIQARRRRASLSDNEHFFKFPGSTGPLRSDPIFAMDQIAANAANGYFTQSVKA